MNEKTKIELGKYCLVLSAASYAGGIIPSLVWNTGDIYSIAIAFGLAIMTALIGAYLLEEGGCYAG